MDKKYIFKLGQEFSNRQNVGKARRELAVYLAYDLGIILQKNTHNIFMLHKESNSYEKIDFDDLIMRIGDDFGKHKISETDLKEALLYITNRLTPEYNIVKFNNCLFDMNNIEKVNPMRSSHQYSWFQVKKKPIFTLIKTEYNYNPEAKSIHLQEFLKTSLKKSTKEETERIIKGVKQVVGYLFTSGNFKNALPIITGIAGGGKSVFGNILIEIFGQDNIADVKLQEIEKNPHASSGLINKHLNIINDSDSSAIKNNSYIKQMTGNDPLPVNPKYKDPYVLPKEEVPKTIIICNSIPYFTKLEQALIERFIIVEFNVKFRGTGKEKPHLLDDILSNKEEIEWFIYESLKEYKNMVDNKEDFILRENINNKNLILKHQKPIPYILSKLISDYDVEKGEKILTNELNNVILEKAKEEGIEIATNDKDMIGSKKLINAIRNQFDLWDIDYSSQSSNGKRYYPYLVKTKEYDEFLKKLKKNK